MKRMYSLFVPVVVMLSAVTGNAQGRFSNSRDSLECLNNLSFYNNYFRQGNIEEAAPRWRKAMELCPPGFRQDIYQHGQSIYRYLIDNEREPAAKSRLLDSLLMMYDLRAQYFPNFALSAKTFKVYDMVDLIPDNRETIMKEAMSVVDMGGAQTDPGIMWIVMQNAGWFFSENKMAAEEFMSLYSNLSELIDGAVAQEVEDAAIVKASMDNLFVVSGVASCENIVTLYTPKFNENPNDATLVKTIVKLLNDGDCIEEDLFLNSVNALNRLEPSYTSAYYLFRLYSSRNDHQNALKMLQEAIDSEESNSVEEAKMLAEMASYYLTKLDNPTRAAEYARAAIAKDDSQRGRGNLILGLVWGLTKCSGNEIESRANYWVAVDYLNRAKAADPSLASMANENIANFSRFFPVQEEAFMYDFIDGQPYEVSCSGLRETTTVRTRK